MSDRQVKLVLEGREGAGHEVETGVPQGSPAAPILFTAYLSRVFDYVENECRGYRLSFMDNVVWWAEGKSEQEIARKLSEAADAALDWTGQGRMVSPSTKPRRRPCSVKTAGKAHGIGSGRRLRGPIQPARHDMARNLDRLQITLKEYHSARMKKARKAMHYIRRLTGQMGMCPDACRGTLVACVQASALYGAELWWDDREGSGVKNRCDEL